MTDSTILPANATARLSMVTGNPCSVAEFAIYLEQYAYEQDPQDEYRFVLQDEDGRKAAEPCAVVLSNLSAPVEAMDVYGRELSHFSNLNYLMNRAGWDSCQVVCPDADLNVKMLARFVSVDVTGSGERLPASSLEANPSITSGNNVVSLTSAHDPASAPQHPAREEAAPAVASASASDPASTVATNLSGASEAELEQAQQKIRTLTIQLNGAQEQLAIAEGDALHLREQNERLTSQLQALRRTAAASAELRTTHDTSEPGAVHPLMTVVEKYLLPSVDVTSPESSGLLADLRAAGYGVALRLVRAA